MDAPIWTKGGCKVAWEYYDSEAAAQARVPSAVSEARDRAARGYDFGYCVPGEIQHIPNHFDFGEVWVVTTA